MAAGGLDSAEAGERRARLELRRLRGGGGSDSAARAARALAGAGERERAARARAHSLGPAGWLGMNDATDSEDEFVFETRWAELTENQVLNVFRILWPTMVSQGWTCENRKGQVRIVKPGFPEDQLPEDLVDCWTWDGALDQMRELEPRLVEAAVKNLEKMEHGGYVAGWPVNLRNLKLHAQGGASEPATGAKRESGASSTPTARSAPSTPTPAPAPRHRGVVDLKGRPVKDADVWYFLRDVKNWGWKVGTGLATYFYLMPSTRLEGRKPQGVDGKDYFTTQDQLRDYVFNERPELVAGFTEYMDRVLEKHQQSSLAIRAAKTTADVSSGGGGVGSSSSSSSSGRWQRPAGEEASSVDHRRRSAVFNVEADADEEENDKDPDYKGADEKEEEEAAAVAVSSSGGKRRRGRPSGSGNKVREDSKAAAETAAAADRLDQEHEHEAKHGKRARPRSHSNASGASGKDDKRMRRVSSVEVVETGIHLIPDKPRRGRPPVDRPTADEENALSALTALPTAAASPPRSHARNRSPARRNSEEDEVAAHVDVDMDDDPKAVPEHEHELAAEEVAAPQVQRALAEAMADTDAGSGGATGLGPWLCESLPVVDFSRVAGVLQGQRLVYLCKVVPTEVKGMAEALGARVLDVSGGDGLSVVADAQKLVREGSVFLASPGSPRDVAAYSVLAAGGVLTHFNYVLDACRTGEAGRLDKYRLPEAPPLWQPGGSWVWASAPGGLAGLTVVLRESPPAEQLRALATIAGAAAVVCARAALESPAEHLRPGVLVVLDADDESDEAAELVALVDKHNRARAEGQPELVLTSTELLLQLIARGNARQLALPLSQSKIEPPLYLRATARRSGAGADFGPNRFWQRDVHPAINWLCAGDMVTVRNPMLGADVKSHSALRSGLRSIFLGSFVLVRKQAGVPQRVAKLIGLVDGKSCILQACAWQVLPSRLLELTPASEYFIVKPSQIVGPALVLNESLIEKRFGRAAATDQAWFPMGPLALDLNHCVFQLSSR